MITWEFLVNALQSGWDSIMDSLLRLLELFITPFGNIVNSDTGVSSWFTNLISWVLSFFGVNFLALTPLEFMLGSTLPIILIFTIYRYVKQ